MRQRESVWFYFPVTILASSNVLASKKVYKMTCNAFAAITHWEQGQAGKLKMSSVLKQERK